MSQFNAPTYEIARPTGTCAITGRELEQGEKFIAMLVEIDPADLPDDADDKQKAEAALGLKRIDVSLEAWENHGRPEKLFSFWKTVIPRAEEKKRMFVDDAVLLNLFHRLGETDNEQRLAFRFVLALILIRKKILRYDKSERREVEGREGRVEYWHVTPKLDITKGPLGKWNDEAKTEVMNPDLKEDQIEQVTDQLSEVLAGDLD